MATNPYVKVGIGPDYNLNPPSDDGATTENNRLQWSKHKGKLGDPIVNWQEQDQNNIEAAFGKTINTDPNEKNTIAGSLAFELSDVTVNNNEITPERSSHRVDTESGAATDELITIDHTAVPDETLLMLRSVDSARVTTLKQQTGGNANIILDNGADFSLTENATIILQRRGSVWVETNRSAGVSSLKNWQFFETLSTASGIEAETSGTIPAGCTKIFLQPRKPLISGSDDLEVQIGDATSYATASTGGVANIVGVSPGQTDWPGTGPGRVTRGGGNSQVGEININKMSNNNWSLSALTSRSGRNVFASGEILGLTGDVTRLKVTLSGSNTFTGGDGIDIWVYA